MPRSTGDERATLKRFQSYSLRGGDAFAEMERTVMGDVWGANGYTTIAQADRLAKALKLRAGMRLLDLGAGRGYPSLYLSKIAGCDVVATDLPLAGLKNGGERARRRGLWRRASFVAASAVHLPFRPASFDAVVHTDVMC